MSALNLFSDDEAASDSGGGAPSKTQLTINEHYAKAFEYRKEREELERLKAKYGSDYDPSASSASSNSDSDYSTDSESAESEDEHGEELTPAVDAAILRTLARIKKRDPAIYDSSKRIFGEERERLASKTPTLLNAQSISKSKPSKPLTIRQVNLASLINPSSRSPSPSRSRSPSPEPLTHVQEQEALRRATIAAFHSAVPGDGDEFLIPREKTQDEREAEEAEYRAFLEREVGDLRELVSVERAEEGGQEEEGVEEEWKKDKKKKKEKKEKKSKKSTEDDGASSSKQEKSKSKAEEDQEFLMNYILNRGWIDHSKGHVPTYKEVTESTADKRNKKKKKKSKSKGDADGNASGSGSSSSSSSENEHENNDDEENDAALLSDTSFDSLASIFEASYNHRFEEPGAASIPTYPRSLPALARREDTKRKEARERRKARKAAELEKRKEEVRRMKALKMREVRRKLEMVGRMGGLKVKGREGEDGEEGDGGFVDEALRELDLEGEWDPEKHDRQMAGLFDRADDAFVEERRDAAAAADGGGDGDFDDDVRYDADGKPVWDDDVDIGDIPVSDDDDDGVVYAPAPEPSKKDKKKKKKKKKKKDAEEEEHDEGGVDVDMMDADVQRAYDAEEEWDGTEEMRKRKLDEYMDEIYAMDFNDLAGGLPTRFKYVPVPKQTFALTPAEILMATDQELNEYMSVKKYAPYRQERGKGADRARYSRTAQEKLRELKAKVGERTGAGAGGWRAGGRDGGWAKRGEGAGEGEGEDEKVKKRKGKKERMKAKAAAGAGGEEEDNDAANAAANADQQQHAESELQTKTKAKSKSKSKSEPTTSTSTSTGHKRKRESEDKDAAAHPPPADATNGNADADADAAAGGSKKKRKRRHKKADADAGADA